MVWSDAAGSKVFARHPDTTGDRSAKWIEYHDGEAFSSFEEILFESAAPTRFVLLYDEPRAMWVSLSETESRWIRHPLPKGVTKVHLPRELPNPLSQGGFLDKDR
jgi:hypothetical protein